MMLVAIFSFAPTIAQACSYRTRTPVKIWKYPYCSNPETDPDDIYWSKNAPYYTGEKYYWWIAIKVTAYMDLTSYRVVVYDRLGAEFMIEGICLDETKYAPYDYTFDYSTGEPYPERHEVVTILNSTGDQVASGHVDWRGVTFNGKFASGDEDTFRIFWTGNSCKVHFQWTIGPMDENETKLIYLVISTDVNPGGHQEFTSTGTTYLNSGATVKVLRQRTCRRCWCWWRPFYSASTAPIQIEVEEHET